MSNILIVIAGPTAVGKTNCAISIAQHFSTAILSADSRQFYKEMNIGTAKPTAYELSQATHFFIDNKSITEDYSVGDFETEALQTLAIIFKEKNIAVMVGGTGLYIKAVCEGLDKFPPVADEIKTQVRNELAEKGIEFIQQEIKNADPDYFNKVDTANPQRLTRALEVIRSSGKPFSSFLNRDVEKRNFEVIKIGLQLPREILYQQINARVDKMIADGLVAEAENLIAFKNLNSLQTVGYTELFDYFEKKTTLAEAITLIKQHTRNYAKRQMTWFRKDREINWFQPNETVAIIKFIVEKITS